MDRKKHILVLGLQFGSEGKAKVIEQISNATDVIVRFNGGTASYHTVSFNNKQIILRQIPCGIVHKRNLNIITQGVLLDPTLLCAEIRELQKAGVAVTPENLAISDLCPLIMPWHRILSETSGIMDGGEAYAMGNRVRRIGIRMRDMYASEFRNLFFAQGDLYSKSIRGKKFDITKAYDLTMKQAEFLEPFVTDTYQLLYQQLQKNRQIVFDGAYGAMRDVWNGPYPYVSSMTALPRDIHKGIGIPLDVSIIGVFTPYVTTSKEYFAPTQIPHSSEDYILKYGTRHDPSRNIGWLDIPMLKYVLSYGIDELGLMKLDALTGLDEILVCTKYVNVYRDEEVPYTPGNDEAIQSITKEYEAFPTWKNSITGIRKYSDLPKRARNFIGCIEEMLGKKIRYISTGSGRENMIIRE
jgi:adenylosuccinate synthase